MNNTYVEDWEAIKDRFELWWKRENNDRPLMRIIARGKSGPLPAREKPKDPADKFLNAERILAGYRDFCETHYFLADAFPGADINLGPGSMALYLGGEPGFSWETVWYKERFSRPEDFTGLCYDEENVWWKTHLSMMKRAEALARNDFYVNIPDIIENLDILSALRGPQNLCFDLLDNPEAVRAGVRVIDSLYFTYFDRCYGLLRDNDGSSSYTAFQILGRGRVAKVQCDFCAMISPQMFRDFVQPSLAAQCRRLDYSVYHLDGPDAIKHVPALMEIEDLNAIQWTSGAGKEDGGSPDWYPIYDKVRNAGKGLWIALSKGGPEDWMEAARRLVKRYGCEGLYFLFPVFPGLEEARKMEALFG